MLRKIKIFYYNRTILIKKLNKYIRKINGWKISLIKINRNYRENRKNPKMFLNLIKIFKIIIKVVK
jgi:hypothetical protein